MTGYHSNLLGATGLRKDLKLSLEGLRWVEGLYGGFVFLAPLSSLDITTILEDLPSC